MSRLLPLLLLALFVGAGSGYALASEMSGDAHGCRASGGGWLVFEQTCRYP